MQEQNNIDIEKMVEELNAFSQLPQEEKIKQLAQLFGAKNIEQIQKEQTVQDLVIAKLKEQKEKAMNCIHALANIPLLEMLETTYEAHLKIAQLELRIEELEKGVKK